MKNAIQLDGYSGYEVLLYKNNNQIDVVRKKSREISQNDRLKKQYEKHLFFLELKNDLFFIPPVIGQGQEGGLFFYEYQFIQGETFIHFIQKNLADNIRIILDKILKILEQLQQNRVFYEQEAKNRKFFDSVAEKILNNLEKCQLDLSIENKILKKIHQLKNHSLKTLCHGDFTFDNLIIDQDLNIWLIDFLDLFYPHYWFDISKLFQDIDGKWYELKHNIRLPNNKMLYIKDYLFQRIKKVDQEYIESHSFLLALVFLRILPYAKNTNDKKIIKNKIEYFIN